MAVVSLYNNYKQFSRHSRFYSIQKKEVFHESRRFFINQNIRLINPEISKTHVHTFTYNHRRGCCTPCTLETRYGQIPPYGSNIVNPSIPSKHRWRARFGWTMMKYTFYVTTSESGGESQGNTYADFRKYSYKNIIGHTCRPLEIDTTNLIILGFILRRTQSEFWWEK